MTTASERVRAYKAAHPDAAAPEIAREMGLKPNAVRVILWRAGHGTRKVGRPKKPRCEHCGGIVGKNSRRSEDSMRTSNEVYPVAACRVCGEQPSVRKAGQWWSARCSCVDSVCVGSSLAEASNRWNDRQGVSYDE